MNQKVTSLQRSGLPVPVRFPPRLAVHRRFEAQVDARPDAPALVCNGVSLTYAELNRRANRLAHRLQRAGVRPETLVGLCAERSLDLVVGLLGILKAGGAYLPIDLDYPADRVAFMLEDANAPVLVTQRALAERLPAGDRSTIFLDDDDSGERETNPVSDVGPENLIYTIYTSGSTGKPKGALLTHHAVDRLFRATESLFDFGPADVWTLFHSSAFDFSVWELWGALLYGGRLVIVPYPVSRSPEAFLELVRREGVTVLNQTPSAFRQFIHADVASGPARPTSLRYVIFGGEALEFESLRPWVVRHGDSAPRLINMYGITETCVHVTFRPVTAADLDAGSGSFIGEPLPDLHAVVMDADGRPVLPGTEGELYVGGDGLARGYLNRPELTAQRFVVSPTDPTERLYRTGDLVRQAPEGGLEYLGRIDQQVKIRGFRIELGEIESALLRHPDVHAVAVALRVDETGESYLAAYLVPRPDAAAAPSDLRRHLLQSLPEFMVPRRFVLLDSLPLTPSGKLDRAALPEPSRARPALDRPYQPPRGPAEQFVARLWSEILAVEPVGRDDRFFDLGGTSLQAVRFAACLTQELGERVPVVTLFEAPTVATAAQVLKRDHPEALQGYLARNGRSQPARRPSGQSGQRPVERAPGAASGTAPQVQGIPAGTSENV